jgi:hypothetical protein
MKKVLKCIWPGTIWGFQAIHLNKKRPPKFHETKPFYKPDGFIIQYSFYWKLFEKQGK